MPMNVSASVRVLAAVALSGLFVGGCYSSFGRDGTPSDAGDTDSPPRDAGPLPSCEELFARTPDVVSDYTFEDFTCTETTFPLARSYLQTQTTGATLRSCFVVTEAHAASGWTVGQMVSADGPGLSVRVAGPSADPAVESVSWDARAIDAEGRVFAGRAKSLRIARAIPVVYAEPVVRLASINPSVWATAGQVNAGVYGHRTRDGSTLRLATYGATWISERPRPLFSWVYPDEQVRMVEVPGVTESALVAEWVDRSGEHWRLVDGDRMTSLLAPAAATGALVLEGTTALPGLVGGTAIAVVDERLLILEGPAVYAFDKVDGTPLGVYATNVVALFPDSILHADGRLVPFGPEPDPRQFPVADIPRIAPLLGYVGDGLLIGVHGVAGSVEVPGPSFVSFENIGADRPIRSATVRPDAYADVLLRDEPTSTAQRLALSFRGCD